MYMYLYMMLHSEMYTVYCVYIYMYHTPYNYDIYIYIYIYIYISYIVYIIHCLIIQASDRLSRYYDNFTLKLEGMQVMVAKPGIHMFMF